jgi:hypothetical protein
VQDHGDLPVWRQVPHHNTEQRKLEDAEKAAEELAALTL